MVLEHIKSEHITVFEIDYFNLTLTLLEKFITFIVTWLFMYHVNHNNIFYPIVAGIWSIRLLVAAGLDLPEIVGWSGMELRNMSRPDLKVSGLSLFKFLKYAGNRLNNLAPFTERDASLAFLTLEGADA